MLAPLSLRTVPTALGLADMTASVVRTFTDPDAYHSAISDAQTEGVVTGRGTFVPRSQGSNSTGSLCNAAKKACRGSRLAIDPKVAGIVFPIDSGLPVRVNGFEASRGDIIVYRAGSTGYDRTAAAVLLFAVAPLQYLKKELSHG